MLKIRKRQTGFTIIEVLIVLAIAGLIMLIVFLAVPGLQRSSRNSARTTDAARVAAAVTDCLNNRNGNPAACGSAEIQSRVGDLARLANVSVANGPQYDQNGARVWYSSICDTTGSTATTGGSSRAFTVTFQLEPNLNRCISSE